MGFVDALLINLAVGTGQRGLDQDLANIDLLRHAILVAVLIVVFLQILLADLGLALKLGGIDEYVFDFAFLWNRVVVSGLVAIVEGL